MPVIKKFNLYQISGGNKISLLSLKPKETKVLTKEEIAEASASILEIFYESDKVKFFDEDGNGCIVRGVENKTFTIEVILEQ